MILINGIDVIIFVNSVPDCILHTDFLSLIDKRNSTQQTTYCTKHLCPVRILRIIRQKTGNAARLIVIFNDICLESNPLHLLLGCKQNLSPPLKIHRFAVIAAMFPVSQLKRGEIKHT